MTDDFSIDEYFEQDTSPKTEYYIRIQRITGTNSSIVTVINILGYSVDGSPKADTMAETMAWVAYFMGKYDVPQSRIRYE